MRAMNRTDGRLPHQTRPLRLTLGAAPQAEASALLRLGHTQVLCAVTLENRVPHHVRGKKEGWLMCEYAMLPRATNERVPRERGLQNGRRVEIQRLLGRVLRSCVDLRQFRGRTLVIDCDVLNADGGTRVASLLAAQAALHALGDTLVRRGAADWPLRWAVGAASVGVLGGELLVDPDYREDEAAGYDLNVFVREDGEILEAQGGSEGESVTLARYAELLGAGQAAALELMRQMQAEVAREGRRLRGEA